MGKGGSFIAGVLVTAVAGCAAAIAYKMFKEKLDEECCCRCDDYDDYDCDCECSNDDECCCGCEDDFECDCTPCVEKEYVDCSEPKEPAEEEPKENEE